ncbi:MAG: hypothetical protein JKY37_22825 [Nannocystaceae bacterium]|nr:hypothetical protein [Nannocystaceae bacterium]
MRQARWLLVVVLAGPGSVGAAGCGPASSGGALATEGSSSSDGSGPGSGTGEVSSTPSDDRLLVLPPLAPCDREAPIPARLRVATWNVGVGLQSSLGEVEAALAAVDADIVVVQEIEIGARC